MPINTFREDEETKAVSYTHLEKDDCADPQSIVDGIFLDVENSSLFLPIRFHLCPS